MANWQILLVDDSSSARAQMRTMLEAKGVRVFEAENGQEGLWRAREERIDLVCSDVHMPIMDGLKMIEELRKIPQYASTPIFIYTSDAAASRVAEGKKAGATAWITKPAKPELLWGAFERALSGHNPESVSKTSIPSDARGTSK